MAAKPDEELLRSRGFGQRLGFGRRPCLIIIDLFNAFTDPAMDLGTNLDSEVDAVNRLLDAAHAAAVPVIFTRVFYEGLADAGVWARKQRGCRNLQAGTRACASA